LSTMMPQGEDVDKMMQQLQLPEVETVAELTQVVYQQELNNSIPLWTACYDMAAQEVLQQLMPKILNAVVEEDITTWQEVQSRCAASAPAHTANIQGEYPAVSFSQAMKSAASEVGYAERTRTQTYEHTTCEQSQRVLPSANYAQDGLLILFPAFSEEAQRRQAAYLSAYDTKDIINTLPTIMQWLMGRIEQAQGVQYGAHVIVDDIQRLCHIYDEAVGLKTTDPETSEQEINLLMKFKMQLESA
jgi:hypothetical protein